MNHTFSYWDSHRLGVAPGVEYTKEETDAARATRPLNYLQQLLLRLRAADSSDGLSSKEKEEKNKRMRQRQGRPQSRKTGTGGANLDKIRPKNNSRERRQSRGPPPHTHCHLSKSTMSGNNPKTKPSYSPLREKKKTATNSMPTKPKSRSPGNSSTIPRRRVPPKPMHLPRAHKSDPCFLQLPQTQLYTTNHKHKPTSPTTTTNKKPPRKRRSSLNDISSTQQDILRSYRRSSVDDTHINSKRIDSGHSSSFQTY